MNKFDRTRKEEGSMIIELDETMYELILDVELIKERKVNMG